ncbi:hypothetical protein [Sphingomonas hylomeconis]|uniref:Uncharacterized protein n=1 Tax=Sphingomonas hylomeconis TaxID=1395958 RepID=A0ABV7SQD7_9SPHN|nr:hypothetical protein [Sphingomonas hylomeconis]
MKKLDAHGLQSELQEQGYYEDHWYIDGVVGPYMLRAYMKKADGMTPRKPSLMAARTIFEMDISDAAKLDLAKLVNERGEWHFEPEEMVARAFAAKVKS